MRISPEITRPKREEAERQVLLEIMQGLSSSEDLQEFLKLVHISIAKVIPAENFLIIIHNKNTDLFEEVYCVDKYDAPSPPSKLGKSISAYVFRTEQPLLLTRELFADLEARGEVELVGTNSASWLGVPLKKAHETIGVMVVQDYEQRDRYSEHDKDLLVSIGGQVAMAIERKQVEASLHSSLEESNRGRVLLFALNNVIQAVQRARTAQDVYREIGVGMSSLNYRVWIMELTGDRKGLLIAATNSSSRFVQTLEKYTGLSARKYRIPLVAGSILQEAIETGETACIPATDGQVARLLPTALRPLAGGIVRTLNTDYMICAPLVTGGVACGLLVVNGLTLSPADVPAITTFAAQASIALENARLYEQVRRELAERKAAEEALRQSEERFKLMAWATKDAVWDWDLQTNQVWWGEGLQKMFHYSPDMSQSDPQWWFDHVHPEDRENLNSTIHQARELDWEFWSKEYRFQREDGTYADIFDRGYILRDRTGKPCRMVGAMIDITEWKSMQATLIQANQQMRNFLSELEGRNAEIALLNEMSRLLQACQSKEEAYQVIAGLSEQLFPGTAGALYLLNKSRTQASLIASWGELTSTEALFAPDECMALRHGQTHALSEDGSEPRCPHLTEPLPSVSYCLPIRIQGNVLGVLHLQSPHQEDLVAAKRQLAHTVVEQTGLALSNLKLREALQEQSIRDPLTGLFNRRYMEEALKHQLSRVTRLGQTLGIIMLDIDHFKDFNDMHGHAAGDAALSKLGQFLQSHVRGEDIACRYGGEEFILIMPDVSAQVVQYRAESLRRQVGQMQIEHAGQSYEGITISAGVAVFPLNGETIEVVLQAADAALYQAKQSRDRVVMAEKAQ